jgi:hypothetical protein
MGRQVLAVVHVSDAVFQMISTLDVDEEAFEPTPANNPSEGDESRDF